MLLPSSSVLTPFASVRFDLQAFSNLVSTSLLFPTSSSASATAGLGLGGGSADFAKHRCAVPAFDLVEFFRGEAGKRGVMTQLSAWGKKWDV
jgi:hypothetical protein